MCWVGRERFEWEDEVREVIARLGRGVEERVNSCRWWWLHVSSVPILYSNDRSIYGLNMELMMLSHLSRKVIDPCCFLPCYAVISRVSWAMCESFCIGAPNFESPMKISLGRRSHSTRYPLILKGIDIVYGSVCLYSFICLQSNATKGKREQKERKGVANPELPCCFGDTIWVTRRDSSNLLIPSVTR